MKQYRFTSADYAPTEPAIDDAVMDADDLARLQQLAGIAEGRDCKAHAGNQNVSGQMSPMGSNISVTGMEKRRLEKEHNIKPGTDEWFKLWFSRPYLTGEKPV